MEIVCLGFKKKDFVFDAAFKTNAIQARGSSQQIRRHRRDMVLCLRY